MTPEARGQFPAALQVGLTSEDVCHDQKKQEAEDLTACEKADPDGEGKQHVPSNPVAWRGQGVNIADVSASGKRRFI